MEWSAHNPQPELFPDISRRRLLVRSSNHFVQARNKVHILSSHEPAPHHETRNDKQDRGGHQRNVICDEVGRVPITGKEDGEAAEEEDYDDHCETVPCRIGLEGGFIREEGSVETLGVPASSEAEVFLPRSPSSMVYSRLERNEGEYIQCRSRTTTSNRR